MKNIVALMPSIEFVLSHLNLGKKGQNLRVMYEAINVTKQFYLLKVHGLKKEKV